MCYYTKTPYLLMANIVNSCLYEVYPIHIFSAKRISLLLLRSNGQHASTKLRSHFEPWNKPKKQKNAALKWRRLWKRHIYESWNKVAVCHFVQSQLGIYTTAGIFHPVASIHKWFQKHLSISCRVTNKFWHVAKCANTKYANKDLL